MPQVMVISAEGYFYLYNIDLDNGGECSLTKQYRQASAILLIRFTNSSYPQPIGLRG